MGTESSMTFGRREGGGRRNARRKRLVFWQSTPPSPGAMKWLAQHTHSQADQTAGAFPPRL